jgi:anti-anti-sigma regulatory factor
MLKITENFENRKTVRLRLDGTLSNETLEELTQTFSRHRNSVGRTIILDMAGVDYMNDHAARELINMRSEQLTIINCSPFIATLLDTFSKRDTGE